MHSAILSFALLRSERPDDVVRDFGVVVSTQAGCQLTGERIRPDVERKRSAKDLSAQRCAQAP